MNAFDGVLVNTQGFAWADLLGQDQWLPFTVSATVTLVGTPTYTGRFRMVGRQCFFQISLVSSTSIATTAGTSFVSLPTTAASGSIGGTATMTNDTTNIAVGTCHVDVATSRCYLPAQVASANTFNVCGWFEV